MAKTGSVREWITLCEGRGNRGGESSRLVMAQVTRHGQDMILYIA